MRKLIFGTLVSMIGLTACSDDATFQESKDFANAIWVKDSIVTFNYNATNTNKNYDIIIDVRNKDNYPYQNFWIFANMYSPKGDVYRDTIECQMTDNDGKWLGSGMSTHNLPISFLKNIKFKNTGKYKIELIQGMRTDSLPGISDIGIRICETQAEGQSTNVKTDDKK